MGFNIDDKDGIGRKCEDGERVVGDAEAGREAEEVEPAVMFFLGVPPLGEAEEIENEEEGGDDVGIGVEAVLPMISTDGDGEGGEDGGEAAGPGVVGGGATDGEVEEEGDEGTGGDGEEVHAPGDGAEGDDEFLPEVAEDGDEGVARGVGDAEDVSDEGVFGGVAEDEGAGHGGEVEDRNDYKKESGRAFAIKPTYHRVLLFPLRLVAN